MSQVDEECDGTCDKAAMVIEKLNMEESSPKKKIQASSHPNKGVIVALLMVTLLVMVGVLILAVTGLTIALVRENAKLRHEISSLEQEQTWNISIVAERMSNSFNQLNTSFHQLRAEIDSVQSRFFSDTQVLKDSIMQLNQTIVALEERSNLRLEAVASDQQDNLKDVIVRLDSLNASVKDNYLQINERVNLHQQDLTSRLNEIKSIHLQQLVHSQKLNASLNKIDLRFSQVIAALEESYDQKFEVIASQVKENLTSAAEDISALEQIYDRKFDNIVSQMKENFTSVAEDISSLNSVSHENYDTFVEMMTELKERINLLLWENYEQLNTTISMIEETTKIKFKNVSAKLEQDFTTTAVSIVNLNSSVQALLQLSSNEIKTIYSVLMNESQALNASLALQFSQLSHMIAILQEKMADQANDTQALNASLASKSLQLNHMIAMLQEKTEKVRNVSFSLNEVYLELSERISKLDDAFENSFGDLEHSVAGLNSSVDDLFQKSVLTAATTQDLNSSFTRLIGDQAAELQSLYQEQKNERKKLNISVNQKYSELNQTIVALEETASTKFKNISEEQDHDIEIVADRIKHLNSSVTMLFQNLAIDSRLGQLNASFLHLLSQQKQDILRGQLEESGRLNATFNISFSNINRTIMQLQNSFVGWLPNYPATSCSSLTPSSPSGYYWIQDSALSAVRVYCDMTRSCGGVTGGWVRVAHLDMTNSSQQCPGGLKERVDSNRRTCVKNTDPAGCASVQYPTSNIQYSRVCGKIIGYQVGTPDAFYPGDQTLSSIYLDGISLTHGTPKQHVWSFVATPAERNAHYSYSCHCMNPAAPSTPSFVGFDYFCDTGLSNLYDDPDPGFLGDNPLWDGQGCGSTNNCCTFNTPPWFHKQVSQATDDMEMRVCRNEEASNEDIAIESIEIYIR